MPSIKTLLHNTEGLGAASKLDLEVLLAHCLQRPRSYLYAWPEQEVEPRVLLTFESLLGQRAQGTPVAYLTGHKEFWSLDLCVDANTLIPRPETETLVECALSLSLPGTARAADWGTGSGAIALALKSERPAWQVIASDTSAAALTVAARNADRLQLCVLTVLADWGSAYADSSLDLVVSNPPYIAPEDPHLAQGDVRCEPAGALVADQQGYAALFRVIDEAYRVLAPGGWLLLEHGYEQAETVQQRLRETGFVGVQSWPDLAGIPRVSGGRLL